VIKLSHRFFLFALCCLAAGLQASPLRHPKLRSKAPEKVADELILQARPGASELDLRKLGAQAGFRLIKGLGHPGLYHLKALAGHSADELSASLRAQSSLVQHVGPNLVRHAHYTALSFPNDPYYQNNTGISDDYAAGNEWNVAIIHLDQVWNSSAGGMNSWGVGVSTVAVADLDTGIRITHDDLKNQTLTGFNAFWPGSGTSVTDTTDGEGHGTEVASMISVQTNNGLGICGGAYGARNLPVKIADNNGNFPLSEELSGIYWAVSHGAKVINMSFGGDYSDPNEQAALNAAMAQGVLLTASSGNGAESPSVDPQNGDNNIPEYPASYAGVLAIGASTDTDTWEVFSNWNPNLFCVSPDGIETCEHTGDHDYSTSGNQNYGTSFAAPGVAALGAMLISNGVPAYECVSRIARTCDKVDNAGYPYSTTKALGVWSSHYGYGRINAYRAMCTLVAPVLGSVTGVPGGDSLAWSAPALYDSGNGLSPAEPLNGYHIYRSPVSGGPYSLIQSLPSSSSSFTDYSAPFGTTEYYVVRALNSNNFETRASNELSGAALFATPTPTMTASPSPTITPTASPTPTITPTPYWAVSNLGRSILAPSPAHQGQPLCLYFDAAPASSEWKIYDLAGDLVEKLGFETQRQQCWDTGKVAGGIYLARISVNYADGTKKDFLQKLAVLK
jgi:hypothetical protein